MRFKIIVTFNGNWAMTAEATSAMTFETMRMWAANYSIKAKDVVGKMLTLDEIISIPVGGTFEWSFDNVGAFSFNIERLA